jgi:3-methyladenine DNA glycosylase AlkD
MFQMNNETAEAVQAALAEQANPKSIPTLQRFFKSGKGEYGEGDILIGVRVPANRIVAKRFSALPLTEVDRLLNSPIHEHRQAAIFILVYRFLAASRPSTRDDKLRGELSAFYVHALKRGRVNNWDLVDSSAEHLLGAYLEDQPRQLLFDLASSSQLWDRRAAVIATFAFIKKKDGSTTFELAKKLLNDPEPLMHKAVGWMLRETGKRINQKVLTSFLDQHAAQMPRTMLSYALEHLSVKQRTHYRSLK